MEVKLKEIFINNLILKLGEYNFLKTKIHLKGRVHYVNFRLESGDAKYNFFFRMMPRLSEFEVYLKVEYPKINSIIKKIGISSDKYNYTFTEKLNDFLEPKNKDWFRNKTSLSNESFIIESSEDVDRLIDYIDNRYLQVVLNEIIPETNSLSKLNELVNNYDKVYDKEKVKPKMLVLSGGLIFQSISALILNTLYDNVNKDELIEMYLWLYKALKDDDDLDKITLKKVIDYTMEKNINL